MVKPSINELTKGKFNRYTLVIAAAKSARYITNVIGNAKLSDLEDGEKIPACAASLTKKEALEDKPVKIAINKLNDGDIKLDDVTLERALNAGLNGIED